MLADFLGEQNRKTKRPAEPTLISLLPLKDEIIANFQKAKRVGMALFQCSASYQNHISKKLFVARIHIFRN